MFIIRLYYLLFYLFDIQFPPVLWFYLTSASLVNYHSFHCYNLFYFISFLGQYSLKIFQEQILSIFFVMFSVMLWIPSLPYVFIPGNLFFPIWPKLIYKTTILNIHVCSNWHFSFWALTLQAFEWQTELNSCKSEISFLKELSCNWPINFSVYRRKTR